MTSLPAWTAGIHHDGSAVYVSNPLPRTDDTITLRLRTPAEAPVERVFIRSMVDGEFSMKEMTPNTIGENSVSCIWSGAVTVTQPLLHYRFKLMTASGALFYTAYGISAADSPDYFGFRLLANYDAPLWVRDTVFYQIFPERFYNGDPSNDVTDNEYERMGYATRQREWGDDPWPWEKAGSMDFFGGDLQGITQKLAYIREMGFNGIYLTPIFKAESNHKYDVTDYRTIDPHFGGEDALAELRAATAANDIKLMLDITPNHCSYTHHWVRTARENPDSDEADYVFYDAENDSFVHWLGVKSLIKLNYNSDGLRDAMYRADDSIMQMWMQPPYSLDAWRLDVANMTGNRGMTQLDHDVWRDMREHLKAVDPDLYLLGEYFPDGTPHLQGDELDAGMNYQGFNMPLRRWLGGEDLGGHDNQSYADTQRLATDAMAQQWRQFMGAIAYPIALQQFNQLDSHDTTRILYVVDDDKALMKLGAALMFGFPGVPCVYYGDEIGMGGFKDPFNRRCMPWDASEWDTELQAYFRRLIEVRKASPALTHGGFQVLHAAADTIAYLREAPQQTMLIIGYRGDDPLTSLTLDAVAAGLPDGTVLSDTLSERTVTVQHGQITLDHLAHGDALMLAVQH